MQVVASGHAICLPAETSSGPFFPVSVGTSSRLLDTAVSRRRKQPTRRRKGGDPSGAGRARPSPGGEPALSLDGAISSGPEFLVPVSCMFQDPETAVTTYEVRLPSEDGHAPARLPADLTVVKACKHEHAIEHYPTVRLSRLGFFREDRASLVWDMQEGVVTTEPRIEERHDDPRDVEEQQQIDANRQHPLDQATTKTSAARVSVKRRQESSFALGDNCLLYCTAIKPRSRSEWSRLEASFEEEGYDHYSPICQPDVFAWALGSMAFRQEGLLGNPITLQHPANGYTARCRNLPVVHGPVVYVKDRNEYLRQSSSETELIVRCIFSKTLSRDQQDRYQDQREYRFALLTASVLDFASLDLAISAEMREAMRQPDRTRMAPSGSVNVGGCVPSPRVLACLSGWPSSRASAPPGGSVLSARLQGSFPITGVHHSNEATTRTVTQTVDEVDFQMIDQFIADEPPRPDDARLVKLTLDGGPDHILSFYDLEGLNGTLRMNRSSNGVHVNASAPETKEWEMRHLIAANQFCGTFDLDPEANDLIVSATPMNPAATVKIDPSDAEPGLQGHHVRLSDTEDTQITVTVASEDGTATSEFAVSIARDLHMDTSR